MKDGKRKLAAIVFTDIVRYSAMSHLNEKLALELLQEHRDIARPIIAKHSGTEVKTIGDAFLLAFETAYDAVQCAIELQKTQLERNLAQPRNRRIQIRIGVHLGDVVVSEGDVYGDGVNIAARLQYVARPGGICMSGSVFYQVDHKIDLPIEARGARRLKNIKNPVALYEINLESSQKKNRSAHETFSRIRAKLHARRRIIQRGLTAAAALAVVSGGLWKFHESRRENVPYRDSRIAVLPFENIGQNGAEEYLSDGLTEELISSLSRIGDLRIVARASIMQYKASNRTVAQIGTELQVGSLIQGSVRRIAGRVRINVQFIDVATQESRWSQVFEGQLDDVFSLQKTIAGEVSRRLRGRSPASTSPANPNPNPDPTPQGEAYLLYLKGRYFVGKRTEEGLLRGTDLLKQAITLDANFSSAYAALAHAASLRSYYGGASPQESWNEVFQYADKALTLDPRSTDALLSLAEGKLYFSYDWAGAEERYRRAIASNPEDPTAHQWYAEFLAYMKRYSEAEQEIQEALRLAPLSLVVKSAAANVFYFSGEYGRAAQHALAAMELDPSFMLAYYWTGRAYTQMGKFTEAVSALKKAVELSGGEGMMKAALAHAYAASGQENPAKRILGELQERAKKRYLSPYDLATIHAALHEKDKALSQLEKARESRASHIVLLSTDPVFKDLRTEIRFQAILKALSL